MGAKGAITVDPTNTVFKIVFGAGVDLNNAFWSTPHITQTWAMSSIFGKAFASGTFAAVQTTEPNMSHYGTFTISGTSLTYTAVPEPTTALAGLLLAAGLLRRRR